MNAEQVTGKILSDARGEAEKILQQANEKKLTEQAELDESLARYNEQTQILARKAAEDKKRQMLSEARMDIAKQYLAQKRKIIDEVFEQAGRKLAELPDEQYRQLMAKLMMDAVETGDEEIIVDKNEKRINHEFVKQLNRKLGPGFKGNLRLSGQREDIGGGFILKRGKVRTNASISVLLEQVRSELETEVAKKLFES